MEIELKNGKFWILENRDGAATKKYLFDEEKPAMSKVKQLMKTVTPDKLVLLTVDLTQKDWKVSQVPWATIAIGLVRED